MLVRERVSIMSNEDRNIEEVLTKIYTEDEEIIRINAKLALLQQPYRITATCGIKIIDRDSIKEINIPKIVKHIGVKAFSQCCDLRDINIPETVTKIGASAFNHCTNLRTIDIPKNITNIGKEAFKSCKNLRRVVISNPKTKIVESAFENCHADIKIEILRK